MNLTAEQLQNNWDRMIAYIEGFEDEVLEGCKNLLNQIKWKALIEVNPQAINNAKKNWGINNFLRKFDAKIHKDLGGDILIGN